MLGRGADFADFSEGGNHLRHFGLGRPSGVANLVGDIFGGVDHHRQMFAQLFEILVGGTTDIIQFLHLAKAVFQGFPDQAGGGGELARRLVSEKLQFPAFLTQKLAGDAQFIVDRLQAGFEQFGLSAQRNCHIGKAARFPRAVAHVE